MVAVGSQPPGVLPPLTRHGYPTRGVRYVHVPRRELCQGSPLHGCWQARDLSTLDRISVSGSEHPLQRPMPRSRPAHEAPRVRCDRQARRPTCTARGCQLAMLDRRGGCRRTGHHLHERPTAGSGLWKLQKRFLFVQIPDRCPFCIHNPCRWIGLRVVAVEERSRRGHVGWRRSC